MRTAPLRIAAFVTPHGFGHAARACAVLEAAAGLRPALRAEIFTLVPEWFLAESLRRTGFRRHPLACDVGLVQRDALREDPGATVDRLDDLLPFREPLLADLAARIRGAGCRAVLCDIAPLGIAVAAAAALPSVLVENFTWDFVYDAYRDRTPGLAPHAARLADWFRLADLRIRTEPACGPAAGDLRVGPIARAPREPAARVRAGLGLRPGERAVLLTMGGTPIGSSFARRLGERRDIRFLLPGGMTVPSAPRNVLLLPQNSGRFHPDLVRACDAVVGKAGYSTVAEAFCAGTPFGCVPRDSFPESPVAIAFLRREGLGHEIPAPEFESGDWIDRLDAILAIPRGPEGPGGAREAADALLGRAV